MLSINLCSAEFVQPDTEESRQLQAKLKDMNNHWDKLGSSLDEWRTSLQEALMQCQVRTTEKVSQSSYFVKSLLSPYILLIDRISMR